MNPFQHLRAWFRGLDGVVRLNIVIASIVASVLIVAVGMNVVASNAPSTIEKPEPIDYVSAVASQAPPREYTPDLIASSDNPYLMYPVSVESVTAYVERLNSTTDGRGSSAVLNPATGVTAALFTGSDGKEPVVWATQYVDAQTDELLAAYKKADMPVTVSTTGTTRTSSGVPPAVRGPMGVPTAASASSGGGIPGWLMTVFLMLTVSVAFYGFLFYRRKKMEESAGGSGGAFVGNATGSKATDIPIPDVTFADVAGCDEAIDELQEIKEFLIAPDRYEATGAKGPKGALLVGPPGTGKTLLARAVAGEAGVPFFTASGSDFVEMYVGVGAKRVRDLFRKAKKFPAAIIFIDEIDAVGRKRGGSGGSNGNQEHENTLNALLVELDGFEKTNIVVIGATNRDDMLDPALLRPGRLDRKVQVPLPDRRGRERILAVHADGKPLDETVSFEHIAKRTPGMSGADLGQLVNEAATLAARAGNATISLDDFDEAVATIAMGKARKSAVIGAEDKKLTAWHEAGHAVCGLAQPDGVNPVAVSIVPRGPAGGVTWFPGADSGYQTRKAAYAELVTAMGGMAAEQLLLGDGEFTTGPSGDLQQGSQLALNMVTRFGMGEWLLVRSNEVLGAASESTENAVKEANDLLHKALVDAKTLLLRNDELFHSMIDALIEFEDLNAEQIDDLVKHRPVSTPTVPPPSPRQGTPVTPVVRPPAPKAAPQPTRRPKVRELANAVVTVVLPPRKRNKSTAG